MKIKINGEKNATMVAPNSYGAFLKEEFVTYNMGISRDASIGPEPPDDIDDEQLAEVTFEDGTVWYAQAGELPLLMQGNPLRTTSEVFEVPLFIEGDGMDRGFGAGIANKVFRLFGKETIENIGRIGALEVASHIERKIAMHGEGLFSINPNFELDKFIDNGSSIAPDQPILLMIHGTGASTIGSFDDLKQSESAWTSIVDKYGKSILGFEHYTFTKDPIENVLDLVKELPSNSTLHLLTQSRGGLVGELLCLCTHPGNFFEEGKELLIRLGRNKTAEKLKEIAIALSSKKITVTKFIRVACPADGTNLVGKRADVLLNLLFNLAKIITGTKGNPIAEALHELVMVTAQQRTKPEILPGIEAMMPGRPIAELLNKSSNIELSHDLYVIASNAGVDGLGKSIVWLATRAVFLTDNDFVVDTDSMFKGVSRIGNGFYKFVRGGNIHHLIYFRHPDVREAIEVALLQAAPGKLVPPFKPIQPKGRNRGVFGLLDGSLTSPEHKKGRPYVILLPGIMGSNLSIGDNEIWVNYGRMWMGDLTKLSIGADVNPNSVIYDAYGAFVKFLDANGYNVEVFPFDWRDRLYKAGNKLAAKIKELQDRGEKVQIIAHSMGGLVVRDIMLNHQETWAKLKEDTSFRCILLGTPWRGSYLAPQVLTGHGKTINSLARLDFAHTKRELLDMFVKYPGLFDLMPSFGHEFHKEELWQILKSATEPGSWAVPSQAELDGMGFKAYSDKLKGTHLNLDCIYYVAGKNNATVSGFLFRSRFGHLVKETDTQKLVEEMKRSRDYQLHYYTTDRGDGSVTWEHGSPFGQGEQSNRLYFVNTVHGELANDSRNFEGYLELLKKGSTLRLEKTAPTTRSEEAITILPTFEPIPNNPEDLIRGILGLGTNQYYEAGERDDQTELQVSVINGHLKFSEYALMVGHFTGDAILSAEMVLDIMMDKALSQREQLGLYPGPIGTNLVVLPKDTQQGAIVVGLGSPEHLTPLLLSKTIETACLNYMVTKISNSTDPSNQNLGISSLLIGSGYANLSLSSAITAIVDGIAKANERAKKLRPKYPQITKIQLVELYKDKAENALYVLNELSQENRGFKLRLIPHLQEVEGSRTMLDLGEDRAWWTRISAFEKKDNSTPNNTNIYVSASNGRARVEERMLAVEPSIVDALLIENSLHSNWDRTLAKTLFELLVPNDFKIAFRNQQNILWILDKSTARYPVELLHYDSNAPVPIGVNAGMIRQLATTNDSYIINAVRNYKALVIGDPKLTDLDKVSQLPAAEKEAKTVGNLLERNNYEVNLLINSTYSEVLKNLFEEYCIMHIASHGVINYGPDKKTGILLSDGTKNMVMPTSIINQITNIPALVFVNSCHVGKVDPTLEKHFREQYQLAANIGTQFIEMGAKAVVVAGWAVNDAAAKVFADVFYEKMLAGETFGNAVKAARLACFTAYKSSNTWGAYQCYGDPFFTLKNKQGINQRNSKYLLGKEAKIDLEKWMNKANSGDYKLADLTEKLQAISNKIEASRLNKAYECLEMEALAYYEIRQFDMAYKKLKALFDTEGAIYSSKAIWVFHLLKDQTKVQHNLFTKYETPDAQTVLDSIVEIGSPSQRILLLCKMAQHKAVQENYPFALQLVSQACSIALRNHGLLSETNKWMVVNYWAFTTCFLEGKNNCLNNKALGTKTTIKRHLEEAEAGFKAHGLPKQLDLLTVQLAVKETLLLVNQKYHKDRLDEIQEIYKRIVKLSGSPRLLYEKVEQFEFYRKNIDHYNPANADLLKSSIKMLHGFYAGFV